MKRDMQKSTVCKPPKEAAEQLAIITWLRNRNYFVYEIPNHKGMRSHMGATEGMPDLQIVLEGGKVIWLEMKRTKGGRLSPAQKKIHAHLEALGHTVILGFGAKDAMEKLREVL